MATFEQNAGAYMSIPKEERRQMTQEYVHYAGTGMVLHDTANSIHHSVDVMTTKKAYDFMTDVTTISTTLLAGGVVILMGITAAKAIKGGCKLTKRLRKRH